MSSSISAQATRQGPPRLHQRAVNTQKRFSGVKASIKPHYDAHSRKVGHRRLVVLFGHGAAELTRFGLQVDRFLLLFLVQQDLGTQWQRELNYERVENARKIQKRKAEVYLHP